MKSTAPLRKHALSRFEKITCLNDVLRSRYAMDKHGKIDPKVFSKRELVKQQKLRETLAKAA